MSRVRLLNGTYWFERFRNLRWLICFEDCVESLIGSELTPRNASPDVIPHRGPAPLKSLAVSHPPPLECLPRLIQSLRPPGFSVLHVAAEFAQVFLATSDSISGVGVVASHGCCCDKQKRHAAEFVSPSPGLECRWHLWGIPSASLGLEFASNNRR